jgi:hypothetical protein
VIWLGKADPVKRFLTAIVSGKPEMWPIVKNDAQQEPVFLFVLCTPYCGSTALAKILDTSKKAVTLHDSGEGQWLVPGLNQAGRWDPEMYIDWDSVRSVWLDNYQTKKKQNNNIAVVIEKSPPNTVRAEQLIKNFQRTAFLGYVRNPYATCSSIHFRYWLPGNILPDYRAKKFKGYATAWLNNVSSIKAFVKQHSTEYFTYEEFCADTESCVAKINKACPDLDGVDAHAKIKVKGNKVQRFTNQNQRRVVKLKPADIKAINSVLEPHQDVLDFFGYELMPT